MAPNTCAINFPEIQKGPRKQVKISKIETRTRDLLPSHNLSRYAEKYKNKFPKYLTGINKTPLNYLLNFRISYSRISGLKKKKKNIFIWTNGTTGYPAAVRLENRISGSCTVRRKHDHFKKKKKKFY